jgi:transposase
MEEAFREGKRGQTRKRYDEQFRRSVVEHWASSGKTAAVVAQEFGLNVWNLRDWKRQYDPKVPEGAPPETIEALKIENRNLRQQLARATSQREILKKTLAIISEG